MFSCRRIVEMMVISGIIFIGSIKTVMNIAILPMVEELNYTENQKQDVLGILFWGFALTKIPSGRLAEVVGPRKVVGYSALTASLLTFVTPILSRNFYILLISRIIIGFLIGAFWPSILPIAAKWIPPTERSSFLACMTASGIGTAATFFLCGFLIATFGWQSTFYTIGVLTLLWTMLWFYLFYDSPEKHPRISQKEKEALARKIVNNDRRLEISGVPWRKLLTSGPVWGIAAAQIGVFFSYATLVNEMPSFIEQVLQNDIRQVGILSAIPTFTAYFTTLACGHIVDCLQKSKKLKVKALRILVETLGLSLSTVLMVFLAIWGYIPEVAITFFTITISADSFASLAHNTNILDISKNFSGTICGIANTVATIPVYFSAKIVALLVENDHSFERWRYLFWMLAAVHAVANFLFVVLCSTSVQKWDCIEKEEEEFDLEQKTENKIVK